MSSDSEDDCYGNIAQKLQSIKNKYKEDRINTTNLLDRSFNTDYNSKTVDKVVEIIDSSVKKDCEVIKNDSDCEDISLDTIIANNSKKRNTRRSKRDADVSADNIHPTRSGRRSKRAKPANDSAVASPIIETTESANTAPAPTPNPPPTASSARGRGRGRKRGRRGGNTLINTPNTTSSNIEATVNHVNTPETLPTLATRLTPATPSPNTSRGSARGRGCGRGRDRTRRQTNSPWRQRRMWLPDFFPLFDSSFFTHQVASSYPTYSIGNTDEYPDECYNQPLFTNKPKEDDVVVLGDNEPENDSIDENEELSVKVYWQNCEYVKFTIRRFQKLAQIFNFFADRENVSQDKLFFTYNDKIIKPDDTPDSITYSIVKFIDGGIINQSVSNIVQKDRNTLKDGIKLKFQCQNVRKPFETMIRLDDKMAVAMMMCAENLEKPLEKLKFHFDGDLITGKSTPRELELEGGECIDVKIVS